MIPCEISAGFIRLANEALQHGVRIDRIRFDSIEMGASVTKTVVYVQSVNYDAKFDPRYVPETTKQVK